MNARFILFFLIICACHFHSQAQSFRYDTVPDPRRNTEKQLFRLEQQPRQQTPTKNNSKQTTRQQVSGPEQKSSFDWSRLSVGGSFGLSFGNDYTSLNISPQLGYTVNQYFSWGGGVGYSYYRWDYQREKISYNYMGFNLFGRVCPISVIALQIQPEIYRMWGNSIDSRTVPCILAGGGVYIPAGRGAMSAMIYYDLIQDDYSPYRDQIVYSVGYVFSF